MVSRAPSSLPSAPPTETPSEAEPVSGAGPALSGPVLAASVALRGTEGHFDELLGRVTPPASARSGVLPLAGLWQQFFDADGPEGWRDLRQRSERVKRRIQDDGATYNVYDEQGDPSQAWPLETLPMLVPAQEWARIERGVAQRARMLNLVLADVYGERRLLDEGLLPPSLVLGHPQYLRPLHGCKPPGGVHLHVVGFDLVRGPDGLWWILGHRTQAPSGLGYVLENRLIIAQQFPEAFRALKVQRLAASFQSLIQGLLRLSPAGEHSRVVLLTPGPRNETYFEHVFLARYLGLTLVEGGDLTVRANHLFLKTLTGLEPVHVVLRRVDDEYLDPLELRSDSALGVPGLLQALRAGHVVVANAPGSGWLESPGLNAFWPGVADRLLGEKLSLPSATSWWCGEEAVWHGLRDKLEDYVVSPTFPDSDTTRGFAPVLVASQAQSARADLRARIEADPAAHTMQARVRPSETPVWTQSGRLEPRQAVLRVYAMADGQGGWRVLPGGMTRVANRRVGSHDPWLSMQRGSASADTWVLTEGPVDPTSLLPQALTAHDLAHWRRGVTSRAAENLFWHGRYTERAENAVRLARLTLESITGAILSAASPPVMKVLDGLVRRNGLVAAEVPSPEKSLRLFERSLLRSLIETGGPTTSVAHNFGEMRRCAANLRERLAPEHWKLIVEADEHFRNHLGKALDSTQAEPLNDVLGVLGRAVIHLAAITGAQTDRMTRDDGWRLLSVGRQIERLDFLANALVSGFENRLYERDDGFSLLLGLFDTTITYRAQYQARREVLPLLHLLVIDTDNPRSLGWVARTMRERFVKLSRHDAEWAQELAAGLPRPEDWKLDAICQVDENGRHSVLIEALQTCCSQARALSDAISRRFFSHVGSETRMVWQ